MGSSAYTEVCLWTCFSVEWSHLLHACTFACTHTHTNTQIFVMARRLVPEGIKILLSFDSFLMDLNLLGSYPTKWRDFQRNLQKMWKPSLSWLSGPSAHQEGAPAPLNLRKQGRWGRVKWIFHETQRFPANQDTLPGEILIHSWMLLLSLFSCCHIFLELWEATVPC